ncbi:Sec7_domain-containing protein [Hexamita inflata]|uniref:Sec7 domain-containing protein n=1 Tax=Hexamita inflata TaxID=28002 RepID=A0AA86V4E3_9EUKA|nr:Sec7 domain-containing protein [Hexamita inflata]
MKDLKQKCCYITESTQFTDIEVQNSNHFEGKNIPLLQLNKVPTQSISLIFSNCSLYSCQGLKFHMLVTHLDLSNNFLDSLSGLQGLNLEYVDLSGNLLTDVAILSTCNKITVLKLNNNQIIKLDLVQSLPKLIELEFENNLVQFLKPIITHQNFSANWLATQKHILNQQLMQLLNICAEQVDKLLSECEPWKYIATMLIRYKDKAINGSLLIIDDQQLTSISFFDYLNITKLQLNQCHYVNFTEVPIKLKHLQVCVSNLQSLQGLEKFQQLETLILRNNSLHRIENQIFVLEEISSLKSLDLAQNNLNIMCQVNKLNLLEYLDISENRLQKTNQLANLKLLKILDVSFNQLQNVDEFKDCQSLEQLNIANNQIININGLNKLTNLVYFNITNNRILSIKVSLLMKQLIDIRTNQNVIQDLDVLYKHINSSSNWISEQDNPTDQEIQEFFNCNDEDLAQKKIELLHYKKQSHYSSDMIIKYKKNVINESLEIQNDDKIVSVAFADQLKVKNTLSVINCLNISFELYPKLAKQLIVFKCKLTKVDYLDQISQLVSLDLSCNSLRFVSEIGELIRLKILILKDNVIANIDNWISELKVLEHLDIENNKLLTVKQLRLPKLKIVLLNGNMIMDINLLKQHKNYNDSWMSEQDQAEITDYEYFLGDNRNDKMVQDLMNQLKLEKLQLENAAKYDGFIKKQELNIHDDNNLCDLGFIEYANNNLKKNITILVINNCQSVETCNIPTKLTKVQINSCRLTQINGLEIVKHLVSVNLSSNNLTNVLQLENLIYIKELFLNDNNITRLDCLYKLVNLRTMEAKNNKLLELNVVGFWTQIVKLFVDNNIINDFTALFNHVSYNPMWISKQNVASINDIKSYIGQNATQELINRELDKYNNNNSSEKRKVDQAQILMYKKKIENGSLQIQYNNKIRSINFVNHLKLTKLSLKQCLNVTFDYFCNITTLHVIDSELTKLDGIQQMVQLIELNLSKNKLQNASLLAHLTNLETLYICENSFEDLQCLQTLVQLTSLDASNNKLLKVDGIQYMMSLQKLSLNNNQLIDATLLGTLEKLKSLNLQSNSLLEVDFITKIKELEYLSLRYNKIYHTEALKQHKNYNKWKDDYKNQLKDQKRPSENDILNRFGAELFQIEQTHLLNELKIYDQKMISKYENAIKPKAWTTVFNVSKLQMKQISNMCSKYNNSHIIIYYDLQIGRNCRIECDLKNLKRLTDELNQINQQFKTEIEEFKQLSFSDNTEVEDISFINTFNIQKLFIQGCPNINLSGFINVKVLQIGIHDVCEYIDMQGIKNWKHLVELQINYTYFGLGQTFDYIENLIQLRILDLRFNRISCIDELKNLVNLTTLCLDGNEISDFSPIKNHPNFNDYQIGYQEVFE